MAIVDGKFDPGAAGAVTTEPVPSEPKVSQISGIKLTATGMGYFKLRVNGEVVSQHITEREAIDAGADRKVQEPLKDVRYFHDYEVKIELE